jgi:hypothetical protein
MDESLQAWGVHHSDFFTLEADEVHAPKALADKAEAKLIEIALDTERLKHGAPVKHEVQIFAFHEDAAEAELTEVRETGGTRDAGRVGELIEAEVEAGEGGHA